MSQSNRRIAAIGFGELGIQIELILQSNNKFHFYFDDLLNENGSPRAFPFRDYSNHFEEMDFVCCLGYKNLGLKTKIVSELLENNSLARSIISTNAIVSENAEILKGVVIYPGANIDKGVRINPGVLVNNSVVISHDCIVGMSTYLSPGVILSGNVEIGNNCFLGAGVVVSNNVTIGDNCTIGIGTVVTKDIPNDSTVIGNPMKFLNKGLILQ